MRVLTFLHSFQPGGVERVALRLHRHWLALGVDARLVLGRDGGAMRCEAAGLAYQILSRERIPTAAWETFYMITRLPGVIRRTKPDMLFCAGNTYTIVAVVMKLLLGHRCPPIVAKISNDLARRDLPRPIRAVYRRWLRIQGRHIDHFTGMAPPMHAEIIDAMAVDPSRVTIIDDPALAEADLARFAAAPRAPHAGRFFLAAGRLTRQKNFALLIKAFGLIARPDDRLTILGEGSERGRLERCIADLGLCTQIELPGYVGKLDRWMADSDVFVLSSDYEGVPAVIAEALAAGIAIVATDCSVSMTDMLDGGRLGTLVPVGDTAALAAAMDTVHLSPDATAARRQQARRFTVERAAGAYVALFRSLA